MNKVIVRKRLHRFEVVIIKGDNEHIYCHYSHHSIAVMNGQELAKSMQCPFVDNYRNEG